MSPPGNRAHPCARSGSCPPFYVTGETLFFTGYFLRQDYGILRGRSGHSLPILIQTIPHRSREFVRFEGFGEKIGAFFHVKNPYPRFLRCNRWRRSLLILGSPSTGVLPSLFRSSLRASPSLSVKDGFREIAFSTLRALRHHCSPRGRG